MMLGEKKMSTMVKPCKCRTETKKELFYKISEIVDDYRGKEGSLIPILHIAQGIYGYLTPELLQFIAEKLNLPFSKVYGVATFYSYFTITPRGEYTIRVCLGTSCYLQGGKKVLAQLKKQLGIEIGETTPDGKYTLEVVRCIGECGMAPNISINNTSFTNVKPENIGEILKSLQH